MKKFENLMSFDEYHASLNEKWDEDIKIEKTGEYADKTIEELEEMLAKLKKQSKKIQDDNKPVPDDIKEKEHQINFALRSKRGWPKGEKK